MATVTSLNRPTFKDPKEFFEKYINGFMIHHLMEKSFPFTKDINLFQYRLGIYSTLQMYMSSEEFDLLNEYIFNVYNSGVTIVGANDFMNSLEHSDKYNFKSILFEKDEKEKWVIKDEYKRLRMYARFLSFLVCISYDQKLEKKILKEYHKWLEIYQ
jgi:hypothetical protein